MNPTCQDTPSPVRSESRTMPDTDANARAEGKTPVSRGGEAVSVLGVLSGVVDFLSFLSDP